MSKEAKFWRQLKPYSNNAPSGLQRKDLSHVLPFLSWMIIAVFCTSFYLWSSITDLVRKCYVAQTVGNNRYIPFDCARRINYAIGHHIH